MEIEITIFSIKNWKGRIIELKINQTLMTFPIEHFTINWAKSSAFYQDLPHQTFSYIKLMTENGKQN